MNTYKNHNFNIHFATLTGVNEAIICTNLEFWIEHNEKNNKHQFDGLYWTYNTIEAFYELFPYMSKKAIYNALKRLEDEGYILTGNHNVNKYDRTKWYTLTEKYYQTLSMGEIDFPKGEMDLPKKETPFTQKGKSIFHNGEITTDINTDINANKLSEKEPKRIIGIHNNVILESYQVSKIYEEYGRDNSELERRIDKTIDNFSAYILIHTKKYKNHYLALRNWLNREFDR